MEVVGCDGMHVGIVDSDRKYGEIKLANEAPRRAPKLKLHFRSHGWP